MSAFPHSLSLPLQTIIFGLSASLKPHTKADVTVPIYTCIYSCVYIHTYTLQDEFEQTVVMQPLTCSFVPSHTSVMNRPVL